MSPHVITHRQGHSEARRSLNSSPLFLRALQHSRVKQQGRCGEQAYKGERVTHRNHRSCEPDSMLNLYCSWQTKTLKHMRNYKLKACLG